MPEGRLHSFAGLLESIFQENRELLLELNVQNVIRRFINENPVIAGLLVDGELHVNTEALADETESLLALGAMVFTVKEYLEIFIGASEADTRISIAITKFRNSSPESAIQTILHIFPDIFKIGSISPEASLENLDELEKVKRIFLHILSKVAGDAKNGMIAPMITHLMKLPCVASISDDMVYMEFSPEISVQDAISQLSEAVLKIGIPIKLAKDVLQLYGTIPEEMGILSIIYGGALSGHRKFGCQPIDALLRNGLGKDSTIILEASAGVEKEILSGLFIKEGLDKQGCTIVVTTGCSISSIKRGLKVLGADAEKAESEGRLIFVDWYSRYTERITSIDEVGSTIKVSNDLTNLAVGIDMALRKASVHSHIRMVMDIASPTIVTEGFDRVQDVLNSIQAKMKKASCNGLVLINPSMHPRDQVGLLEDIFDGTMSIERTIEHGKIQSTFRIAAFSGGSFSSVRLGMAVTE
ncbi:MAG: ATPase domain-containing protein, partial [Thermoplasmata archaeon]|nr:ATPase domain-containing protein [Thermoplasmata archaeon]